MGDGGVTLPGGVAARISALEGKTPDVPSVSGTGDVASLSIPAAPEVDATVEGIDIAGPLPSAGDGLGVSVEGGTASIAGGAIPPVFLPCDTGAIIH